MDQSRASNSEGKNPTMKQFPFIVMGVSNDEINKREVSLSEKASGRHNTTSRGDSPLKDRPAYGHCHNPESNSTIQLNKQVKKKISPFTTTNVSSPTQFVPVQKPLYGISNSHAPLQGCKANDNRGDCAVESQRQKHVPAPAVSKSGDYRDNQMESKESSKVLVGAVENSDEQKPRTPRHKYFISNVNNYEHLQRVQDKIASIFTTMQDREDEICRLKAEVKNLKDIIHTNSAESCTSKNLCQHMQKQLNTIEEKIAFQRLEQLNHSTSSLSSRVSSSDITDFEPDFDKFLNCVKQLNQRIENGQTMELCFITGGATFKRWDGINITMYKNGLLLDSEKDFMSFSSSRAKYFVQDVIDGFFPHEFQNAYPQGVYMAITDNRKIIYAGDTSFSGCGKVLDDTCDLPKLVPSKNLLRCKSRQYYSVLSSVATVPATSNFVNETTSSCNLEVPCNLKHLPALRASYEVLLKKRVLGFEDKMITAKLKNIITGQCFSLQVSIFAQVGEVTDHLNNNIEPETEKRIVLIQSVPVGILSVPTATLQDYGVQNNVLLYLRIEK